MSEQNVETVRRLLATFERGLDLDAAAEFWHQEIDWRAIEGATREEALQAAGLPESGMAQENVEVVRGAVDAVNKRDPDAFISCLRPDVEWEESGDVFPGPRGIYRGRAEVQKWFGEAVLELWESLHLEVEEIAEASDDRVFLEMFITARGRGSGVETELRAWQVFWFADGKIARRQVFWARDEALEAAGLPG